MRITDLPIDDDFKELILSNGIEELYPPQAESVTAGLLEGQNFVIAVPTASGKTLIAILAIFSALTRNPGSKAVYLAPLRALASEKFEEFRTYAKILNKRVAISTGELDGVSSWLKSSDIIIATNEKFDSLIRHQVSWLQDISIIVSDEVHLINDYSRGPVLEIVISLVRRNLPECQLLALSATIVNADELAEWMHAKLIQSEWRPITLNEGVWLYDKIKFANGDIKNIDPGKDKDGYITLATDIVSQGGQALVFASSRKSAMASADNIGKKLVKQLSVEDRKNLSIIAGKIREIGEKTDLRERLAKAIERGSAFHHAGLVSGHRKLVEDSFKSRIIKVISSTPSLAAGVNLPGRRVIIRSLSRYSMGFGSTPIPVLEYKQMAGRAGRPQYDSYGEAIILAKNEDDCEAILQNYIRSPTEKIYSQLSNEQALRSHLLAFIASNYVNNLETAMDMFANTFYGYQNDGEMNLMESQVGKAFELLITAKLISKNPPHQVTPFGRRTSELYLDPLSAKKIKEGLERSKSPTTQIDDLIYLQLLASTPDIRSYSIRQKDFEILYSIAEEYAEEWLDEADNYQNDYSYDLFFATLKSAKIVHLWLSEVSDQEIANKMGVNSGDLQAILSSIQWLLHSAIEISKIFKWKHHQESLQVMLKRLKYGINKELLALVEISGIGRVRARSLFNSGYKTIESILKASIAELAKVPGFGSQLAANLKEALTKGEKLDNLPPLAEEDSSPQQSLTSFFD